MTRERLAKELDKIRSQIEDLQKKERELRMEKDAADMAASMSIVEKKKISPELLKAICEMKEEEIKVILESSKKENGDHDE